MAVRGDVIVARPRRRVKRRFSLVVNVVYRVGDEDISVGVIPVMPEQVVTGISVWGLVKVNFLTSDIFSLFSSKWLFVALDIMN